MKQNFISFISAVSVILIFNTVIIGQSSSSDDLKSGINPENYDHSIDPNSDFYDFACNKWFGKNPIPPQNSRWGTWDVLIEQNNEVLKKILEDASKNTSAAPGSIEQKLGDLYFTAMDSVNIEKAGMEPLKKYFEMIDGISTQEEFQKVFAYLKSAGSGGLFSVWAGQDDKNSRNVILQFYQGGLGLSGKEYYTKNDENSVKVREKYLEFMRKIFTLLGNDNITAGDISRRIMDIEQRLADASMTRLESRQAEATYHPMSFQEVKDLMPDYNFEILFNEIGVSDAGKLDKGINIGQPEFFKELNRMLTDVKLEDWKNYLKWNLIRNNADKLSSDFEEASFEFYGKTLRGSLEQRPRWKKSLSFVESAMGEPLGQLFVELKFKPETKTKALQMVNNIKESFKDRIIQNDWMSEATKKEALKKLSTFNVKIGYTDEWKDYSGLEINRNSFFDNMIRASKFRMKQNMNKIGKPVNKNDWFMYPQTVNAYYSSSNNEIVFPAGILQPPFYDPSADDAVNYGGIGAVIGHEISHGFDDQGRKYDSEGNMKDWWTEEDAANFKVRADMLAKQYSGYNAVDSYYVDGNLTLGENIADLGGLITAYHAYMKTIDYNNDLILDGFTPSQRFFLGFAQMWMINYRPELMKTLVKTDSHSPPKFRVNGTIKNVEEFINAFGGKEGDPMINPKDKRIVIW
ncbi:MAG TPA: M13 family metallopeptidase [Ignavibacteria bacterium]|nr:hypothetical protein [Bacteroidota bacterium]HRI85493.1 M13 family metallopeptidase [Ignavibacteria bacterium]HRJ99285.1 M13 family metallopeptidase [Ignavibacteria bacterium]